MLCSKLLSLFEMFTILYFSSNAGNFKMFLLKRNELCTISIRDGYGSPKIPFTKLLSDSGDMLVLHVLSCFVGSGRQSLVGGGGGLMTSWRSAAESTRVILKHRGVMWTMVLNACLLLWTAACTDILKWITKCMFFPKWQVQCCSLRSSEMQNKVGLQGFCWYGFLAAVRSAEQNQRWQLLISRTASSSRFA